MITHATSLFSIEFKEKWTEIDVEQLLSIIKVKVIHKNNIQLYCYHVRTIPNIALLLFILVVNRF